jgi:hypothetical protein
MTTSGILQNVADRLIAQLGDAVDRVWMYSGALPESVLAGIPMKGDTGFTILVGIDRIRPATRTADDSVANEVADVSIGVVRVHTGLSRYEEEVLLALDMIDTVRAALNDATVPPWWITSGFLAQREQGVANASDPDLSFTAYILDYQYGVCRI